MRIISDGHALARVRFAVFTDDGPEFSYLCRCPIHAVRRRSRSETSTISAQAPGNPPLEDVSALRVERFAEIQGCDEDELSPKKILKNTRGQSS
jgi:hypothetical protein